MSLTVTSTTPSLNAWSSQPVRSGRAPSTATDSGDAVTTSDTSAVTESAKKSSAASSSAKPASAPGSKPLTAAEQRQVRELQARDLEVRQHEAAHQAAGGDLVGGASFSYQTGPDQKRYAVGGEVSVDSTPVADDPAATIAKMRRVQAAALAPASPSGQDRSVAAQAAQLSAQAALELAKQQGATSNGSGEASSQPERTTQQRRAVDGYAQASATQIAQVTGTGIAVSA